jgi:hypothetical protein
MEIACDFAKGVDVGDKNHSRKFCSQMIQHFYSVLKTQMNFVLRVPLLGTNNIPPFAVIADKMTPTRGTLQIVGIVTYINGSIVALMIDVIPIAHHTGKALAAYIYTSLCKYFSPEHIKSRY